MQPNRAEPFLTRSVDTPQEPDFSQRIDADGAVWQTTPTGEWERLGQLSADELRALRQTMIDADVSNIELPEEIGTVIGGVDVTWVVHLGDEPHELVVESHRFGHSDAIDRLDEAFFVAIGAAVERSAGWID